MVDFILTHGSTQHTKIIANGKHNEKGKTMAVDVDSRVRIDNTEQRKAIEERLHREEMARRKAIEEDDQDDESSLTSAIPYIPIDENSDEDDFDD